MAARLLNEKLQTAFLTSLETDRDPVRSYFELRRVCKAFSDRVVLKNANFHVKGGETYMITISDKWEWGLPRDSAGRSYFLRTETTEAA
jgi:hypothetical protein